VTHEQLQDTYNLNRVQTDNALQAARQANKQLTSRLATMETEALISQTEYSQAQAGLHRDIDRLKNTITLHYKETTARVSLQAIDNKQEEVIKALDSLYKSIKEDLLTDTKEYLAAKIDFDMKHDKNIQRRITTITKDVLAHKKMETAMNQAMKDILHKKLAATINDATMNKSKESNRKPRRN
jgi:hypothetical protein